ncbi:MAG TPA: hypothetical protein VJT67_01835, partial [Longimicrobiaceae bacterium]|nr:hypothetical protein [Longimicrobiaceae bacterium]
TERDGITIIQEQVGRLGSDRVIQRSFGGLRVCAMAEGLARDDEARPSGWVSHASRVVLETAREGDVRRMEIAGGRTSWSVNGASRSVDAAAEAWRDRLLAVLDGTWDLSQLRGHVSALRGQISAVHGQRSALMGEISSLRGQVSALNGQISAARGQESSLRGEISAIRGQVSAMRGAISAERGAISSLNATGGDRDAETAWQVRAHEDAIRRLEGEIARFDADARVREVERRIESFNTDQRVAELERQIRTFGVDGRVGDVERRITALDVDGRVADLERQITALDADRRGEELETRIEQALERLRAVLGGR